MASKINKNLTLKVYTTIKELYLLAKTLFTWQNNNNNKGRDE